MNDVITLVESYESACNTSNLLVKADRRGSADMIVAAGWCDSHLGMALLRLRSEWESSAKPTPITQAQINALAENISYGTDMKAARKKAQTAAEAWYGNELSLLRIRLKGLPAVSRELYMRCERKGMPTDMIPRVMAWWLDPICHACHGHGKTLIPGTPSLSAHNCPKCRGEGKLPVPHHQPGKWLANVLSASIGSARVSLRGRFVHQHVAPNNKVG